MNRAVVAEGPAADGGHYNRMNGPRHKAAATLRVRSGMGLALAGAGDRVVAFAGQDGEAFAADADFNGVVILGFVVAAGIVAESILVAGLFGDARVKIFE